MKNIAFSHILVTGILCVVAAGGCKKPSGAGPGDGLNPDFIGRDTLDPQELSMNLERFEFGDPIPGEYVPVYFAYDSARIPPDERVKADAVAQKLREMAGAKLVIEGHCDERGSREYNLALGERRALAVRAYLSGLGIDPDHIQTKSYGEENPVALGHDEASWSLNRRAEFLLFN